MNFENLPLYNRLAATSFMVNATSFEKHCLWTEFSTKGSQHLLNKNVQDALDKRPKLEWKQLSGIVVQVSCLDGRPVNLSLFWDIIDGHYICFYDCCSQVVDWAMIDKWLDDNYHGKWAKGTRKAHCDAQNFHLCLHAIEEFNRR